MAIGKVQFRAARVVTEADIGASPDSDAATNTPLILAAANLHKALFVPPDVAWDPDALSLSAECLVFDAYNQQIITGGCTFGLPHQYGYIRLSGGKGGTGAGVWAMPRGRQVATSGNPSGQSGSFKVFHDDFYDAASNPDAHGNTSYRDGGLTAEVFDGAQGLGVISVNAKSAGLYVPLSPELHFSLQGTHVPLRLMYLHPNTAVAGNFFSDAVYNFDSANPTWYAGMTVVQGQLIILAGKIYEAQAAGTTGATQPTHATYRKQTLTLSSVVGTFLAGETIHQDPGTATEANGDLESVVGSDYLLENWNQIPFTVSGTVTGATSGATATIDAVVDTDVQVDNNESSFVPPGPPVAGLTVSDGAILWRFLDDVKMGIRGAGTFKPVVILGDDDTLLPYPGHDDCTVHLIDGQLVYNDVPIRFLNADGSEAEMQIYRNTLNQLIITAGGTLNGEVRIHGGDDSTGFLRVLDNQVTTSGMPFAGAQVTKASAASTLNVSAHNAALFNDLAPTNFTGFTGMRPGQLIAVQFASANTTLVHSATFQLPGGVNQTPNAQEARLFYAITASAVCMISG